VSGVLGVCWPWSTPDRGGVWRARMGVQFVSTSVRDRLHQALGR